MIIASGIEVPTDKLAEVCRKYHVTELALFGSAARGEMGRSRISTYWWS